MCLHTSFLAVVFLYVCMDAHQTPLMRLYTVTRAPVFALDSHCSSSRSSYVVCSYFLFTFVSLINSFPIINAYVTRDAQLW